MAHLVSIAFVTCSSLLLLGCTTSNQDGQAGTPAIEATATAALSTPLPQTLIFEHPLFIAEVPKDWVAETLTGHTFSHMEFVTRVDPTKVVAIFLVTQPPASGELRYEAQTRTPITIDGKEGVLLTGRVTEQIDLQSYVADIAEAPRSTAAPLPVHAGPVQAREMRAIVNTGGRQFEFAILTATPEDDLAAREVLQTIRFRY